MKYIMYAIMLTSMLLACQNVQVRSPATSEISKELNATVALYTQVEKDNGETVDWSYCSATWIDDKHILTAAHCVRGIAEKEADKRDEESPDDLEGTVVNFVQRNEWASTGPASVHKAVATRVDEDLDLALLTAALPETYEHISIPVATQSPGLGEKVNSVGHPRQLRWTFIYGTVSNYSGQWIIINNSAYFGNSGGGVFSNGELVGVCSRFTNIPQELKYTNVRSINEFLNRDCDGTSCHE
jgi:hypothetical protein